MQTTGQKTGKNPPKNLFFPAPPAVCMGLAWDVAQHFRPGLKCCNISGQALNGAQRFRPDVLCTISGLACNVVTFQTRPEMLQLFRPGLKSCATSQAKPIQTAGGAGKKLFFGGFLPVFCPVFCFFAHNLYMKCLFCKKNRSDWPPLAIGASIVKVRHV